MARVRDVRSDELWRAMSPLPETGGIAEEIAGRIQTLIVSDSLEVGSRLPSERDLAEWLSTSRPTVSQAIRILVVRGLVESRRGSGIYVTRRQQASLAASVELMLDLDQQSVPQLNELRLLLEISGVRLAIERATQPDLGGAEEALDALRASVGDTEAWVSADTRFHASLVGASGNPFLSSVYESVHGCLIDYQHRAWIERGEVPAWLGPEHAESQLLLHEPILAAVEVRALDAAETAVRHHHAVMAAHLGIAH